MHKTPPQRADLILTVSISAVAVLVLALVLVLGAGARLYGETREQRGNIRAARDALIEFSQQNSEALAQQRAYLLSRDEAYLALFNASKESARTDLAEVRALNAGDSESLALVSSIETDLAGLFEALDNSARQRRENANEILALSASLEQQTDALHASILRRSDQIRIREDRARQRVDTLAGILALLSLATCGLAVLALRRERRQWRLATEAAEDARAKAAASDLAKTRFLAVASHDMRQPLHALTLYLSALERRVETPEAREIITKMDRATQSMVGMFASLLDLARIQAGVVKPEREDVPLQDVIERIVAEHPGRAVEAAPTSLVVDTDPVLLERILRNLVSNALKHGGGKARIEIARRDNDVEIAVADNGPGIAEEDQERIFEEFVRIDGRAEGLGLGLAIVDRIANLIDTRVEVKSALGHGARFTLRVPRAVQSALIRSEAPSVTLDGAPVLVVDDDPMAREAVAAMLADLNADVRSAGNEAEAEAVLAASFKPRLLVMDLRIDGALDGIDIARRLRTKVTPAPQVIVVTGDTASETLVSLRESGFQWLIKPVDPRELGETIAKQLDAGLISST